MRVLLIMLIQCSMAFAAGDYGDVRVDAVTSIYDGDTITCTIKGWPSVIGERIPVRVYGIDTPEMDDKRPDIKAIARRAKQFAVTRIRSAKVIELRNIQRDKYFRILADVYLDGASLGDMLLSAGLAKRYGGGTKEW